MLVQAEENWAVGYIKGTLAAYDTCRVKWQLLYAEHISIDDLQLICIENYWYVNSRSDMDEVFIEKDGLRLNSCRHKICGLTADLAVKRGIDRIREPIYNHLSPVVAVDKHPSLRDIPQYREYRIQWYARPLYILFQTADIKHEQIPIWHLT